MNPRLRTGLAVFALVLLMLGLSFAAVPFYRLFCQRTGYAGTTQVAKAAPGPVLARTVTIKFDSSVARDMPWRFAPQLQSIDVRLGEKTLVAFNAENLSDHTVTGTATYNVTPEKVGRYFKKIQCFCFTEQTLKPHERVQMPVLFFVDPALADDPQMDTVNTITLSYTFFNQEP